MCHGRFGDRTLFVAVVVSEAFEAFPRSIRRSSAVRPIGGVPADEARLPRGVVPFPFRTHARAPWLVHPHKASIGPFPRENLFGIAGDIDRLAFLQERLETALASLGFTREPRPFSPHLTLARLRDNASSGQRRDFGEAVSKIAGETRLKIPVAAFSLMRSELTPSGAIYTRLAELKLSPGAIS